MTSAIEYNIKTDLENKVYTATFSIKSISQLAQEQLDDLGNIKLNVGGDITKEVTREETETVIDPDTGVETTNTITVTDTVVLHKQGDKFISFPVDLPFTRSFNDVMLGGKAEEIAQAYVDMIEDRIKLAVDEIVTRVDNFSDDRDILLP